MSIYDLRYPGVVAEVHYQRPDGLLTYAEGMLTTEHPSASYGLPVWVAGTNYRHTDPMVCGQAYGPGDLPVGYQMIVCPYHHLTDSRCLPVAARSAGYRCELAAQ